MAENVGSIVYDARIDTAGLQSDARKADSIIKDSGDGMSKHFDKVKTAATVLGAAVAAMGGVIVKNAIDSASELQGMRASFESMTGSAESARKVLSDLNKFSFETAFSSEQINKSAQLLLGAGLEVKDLGKYMKNIGDVAGATGADLGQLTLPLSQALSRGKLQTQDYYQILNSGAGKLGQILKKELADKGMGDFEKAMSDGKVTSDILFSAIEKSAASGGFAFQGAIKQAETFDGRVSNMKESISNVALAVLGVNKATGDVDKNGIFAMFSNSVKMFGDWITVNKDGIINFFAGIGERIKVFGETMGQLGPNVERLFGSIRDNLIPILSDLWHNIIEPLIPVLGTLFVGALKLVIDTAKVLVDGIGWVYQKMQEGNPWVWGLISAFTVLAGAMAFNAIFNALAVGFATLTLVTIPSVMTSVGILRGLIASPLVFGAIAVAAAVASIMLVFDAANKARDAVQRAQDAANKSDQVTKDILAGFKKRFDEGKMTAEEYRKAVETQTRIANNEMAARKAEAQNNFFTPMLSSIADLARRIKSADFSKGTASGWATGGYTGRGGVNEVAGVVHRGEYVIPKSQVNQTTGLPYFMGQAAENQMKNLMNNSNRSVPNITDSISSPSRGPSPMVQQINHIHNDIDLKAASQELAYQMDRGRA